MEIVDNNHITIILTLIIVKRKVCFLLGTIQDSYRQNDFRVKVQVTGVRVRIIIRGRVRARGGVELQLSIGVIVLELTLGKKGS